MTGYIYALHPRFFFQEEIPSVVVLRRYEPLPVLHNQPGYQFNVKVKEVAFL